MEALVTRTLVACCRVLHWPSKFFQFLTLLWILTACVVGDLYKDYPPTMFEQKPMAGSAKGMGNLQFLQCLANGDPSPVYRWLKDGRYISPFNTSETTMKIQNIQRSDAGVYQCQATNNHGAILSDHVQINVAYMVPFAYTGNQDKVVDQGQARIIDLPPIDSFPPPSLTWFEWVDGNWRRIPTAGQRYHKTLRKQLVVLETRQHSDNNKMFQARALLGQTGEESTSQTFVLKVQNVGSQTNDIPPEIVIPPSHTTVVQGQDSAVLECVANSRPASYLGLKWYKRTTNGAKTPIEPDNVKYLLPIYRRKLTILNPKPTDSGTYVCEATFSRPGGPELPTAMAEANLTVQVKPTFTRPPPAEISKDVGITVVIPCLVAGLPEPVISWHRNAVPIGMLGNTRYQKLEDGNLQISASISEDSGIFQCFASNPAGEINRPTWVRILSFPPEITVKPTDVSVIEGEIASFPCDVIGAPKPTVSWHRELVSGASEVLKGTSRVRLIDNKILIQRTEVSDTGDYVCTVTNTLGTDVARASLTVTRRTQIITPPTNASVIMGSNTVLDCGVSSDPNVDVTWRWFQNAQRVVGNDGRRTVRPDGSLEIKQVRNDDIGMYRCQVFSRGGNDTEQAHLIVIQIPYSPSIIEAKLNTQSNRAVDIKWSPGFNGNSPIRAFVVQYRQTSGDAGSDGWVIADNSVPASERQYTIRDLLPAARYTFRVSAVNDVGEGQPSQASNVVELPQQPPSGPPNGVFASPRSNSSIIIQWQAPDRSKWNGALLGYMIRYKPSGYPDTTLQYKDITDLKMSEELAGLIVFQEYEMAVAAYNGKGIGVYSAYFRERTMEGRPTAPPTSLRAMPANSTAIKLTWMPPDSQFINGINQGYKILAAHLLPGGNGSEAEAEVVVPSNISNMLGKQTGYLTSLKKFTDYSITVLCFTAKGNGPATGPVLAKTNEDVPDQVGSIEFDRILDTSLLVIWTPPENINGLLQGYTLTYMRKNETISKVTKDLLPMMLTYTITGLTATTVYTIEVFARTRVGAGPPRSADIESGVPPVFPNAPENPAFTNIQARSVLLQFEPGFSGHTSISLWVVQAQRDLNEEVDWEVVYSESSPEAESLTVTGLRPYTRYRLRMVAENIKGQSSPSKPTEWFQTLQAAPEQPPKEVSVRAINETALRVGWTPLVTGEWNGNGRGYKLQYRPAEQDPVRVTVVVHVPDENANSHILAGLQEWTVYLVQVAAYNRVGSSAYGLPPAQDRTRESVPSAGPSNVTAWAISPTSIKVTWMAVPAPEQNGHVRGYKIHYKAEQNGESSVEIKVVNSTASLETVLTGLRKYVWYQIQVLAYTRIGDGVLSDPPEAVRTHESVPGPPSSIYFPTVTHSTARIVWSPPREPNGMITKYRVTYRLDNEPPSEATVTDDLPASARDLYVSNLSKNKLYLFDVTARTTDWGEPADVRVYTVLNRREPDEPSLVRRAGLGARWVTVTWQEPKNDGFGPIRNYTIQVQKGQEDYVAAPDYIPHNVTAHTVTGLKPYTQYKFRVAASNDIGLSPYSVPSEWVLTDQAAPDSPPLALKVTPKSQTSVMVTWKLPPEESWNGHLVGYELLYREALSGTNWQQLMLEDRERVAQVVTDLRLFTTYEFKMQAFNVRGRSAWTPVVLIYLEIVPTASPQNVQANAKSSTEIEVTWEPPPLTSHNGELVGYKIYVWVVAQRAATETMKTVGASETGTVLGKLEMYTEYAAILLAFNAAGDGPNTTIPTVARTDAGVPGPPGELQFVVTSLTSLNVSWASPSEANGEIQFYEVSYNQAAPVHGESRHVQVKLSGDKLHYLARELEEDVKYVFRLRARTTVDWGPTRSGNITVGPQPGSPEQPDTPRIKVHDTSVTLDWVNGDHGDSNITSYIIQARERDNPASQWETVVTKNSPETVAIVSFFNLKPNAYYQFRVIAINSRGVSHPSRPSEYLKTLDVDQKPFYQWWWFQVIVALVGLIVIISVVSLLCLTGRNRRKKYKEPSTIPRTTVQLSEPGSREDESGFSTFQMRRSQRPSQRPRPPRNNTLPPYTRSPPRPSPGSVNYSDDDYKGYPDEDSSTTSEKPSDISSSGTPQGSDSEPEMEKELPPPPFPNQYANGDVQQSWKQQGPSSGAGAYSYPDSEQDSQYQLNLNGGHMMVNNMAGSRAPLPGFSSFV